VDGVEAAVVTSHITLPLDFSLDFRKMLGIGGLDYPGVLGLSPRAHPVVRWVGTMSMNLTSWLDLAGGKLLKIRGAADFDETLTFEGFPRSAPSYRLSGKMDISLDKFP
jgi:hypothetical protein